MKYLLFICILLLSSCGQSHKEDIEELARQWIGREIICPEGLVFTIQGKDTLANEIGNHRKYTIINYVDTTGCSSCQLQLPLWKKFMEEVGNNDTDLISLRFFLFPKDTEDLMYTLKYNDFKYPVCFDLEDSFNRINRLPLNQAFHTFLIDQSNRILAIGNPIRNVKIKELYLNIIRGESSVTDIEQIKSITTIDINSTSADMGSFDWQQEQTATFTLTNTGDKLFVIDMVDTSCGCITVDYKQKPIRPGDSIALQVTYKAKGPGYFRKTLRVYCNAENTPTRLTVSGMAEKQQIV